MRADTQQYGQGWPGRGLGKMTGNRRKKFQLVTTFSAIAFSCICTMALLSKAHATVYKCTDANNNVSYNQTPCPIEEKAEPVLTVRSKVNADSEAGVDADTDCRIANNFSRQIATRMRSGESSGSVFDSYGGIDAIPRTAVGIINYVYSHKNNLSTVPQRITALSAARCSAGSYGPVACDDFPYTFIAERGGCERAATNTTAAQSATTTDD